MAITSKKINIIQLDKELGSKGLITDFNDLSNKLILPADNSDVTEDELNDAIAVHIAMPTEAEERATARQAILDRLGLTAEEAQLLLGGN
jgi:hypothetical protein